MPAVTPETLRALATIGARLASMCRTPADLHRQIAPELQRGGDELYRSPETAEAFPLGLTSYEALGYSWTVDWAAHNSEAPWLVASPRSGCWAVQLPGVAAELVLLPRSAAHLLRALLLVRRIIRPSIPWRRRDFAAEEIERMARVIEVTSGIRPEPARLDPPVILADLDRDWRIRREIRRVRARR